MDLIALEALSVGYGGRAILPPVNLTLRAGRFLGVVGHSGSGKSTLMKTMLGLLPPVAGKLGLPLGRLPRFGYLPQRAHFEPSVPMTTLEMVVMGRYRKVGLFRSPSKEDRALAAELLREVGLADFVHAQVHSLSGGQRQRALIARALVSDPEVLVLDEPTNGLDIVSERSFLDLVERFRGEKQLGVVMISHELPHLAGFADEILVVDRERFAIEQGSVDEVISAERLSRLYGAPVVVQDVHGHRAVFLDCEHVAPHPHGHAEGRPHAVRPLAPGGQAMSFLDAWEMIGDSVIAAVICAALAAYVGVYVLMRRVIFVSAAIAQASGLGIALSFWVGSFVGFSPSAEEHSLVPQLFALAAALACALVLGRAGGGGRLAAETRVGLVWVIAGAVLHLVLSSSRVVQEAHEVDSLLYGSAVLISRSQLWVLGAVAVGTLAVHLLFRKELTFVSLDPEMAQTLGYRVALWDAVLFGTLAVAISFVVRSLGALPAFAFLVIPGAIAQLVAARVSWLFPIAVGAGVLGALAGYAYSFQQDLPTGPSLVAATALLLVPAGGWRLVAGARR